MKSIAQPTLADSKVLIFHDIRSALNVGALFRTADAVGIDRIYLSSVTPAPIDRFGRLDNRIAKTALGAEKSVAWETYTDITALIRTLQMHGMQIITIEQSPNAVDYKNVHVKTPVGFILGNEVEGIAKDILAASDIVTYIPMEGKKESLNVSVAAGVALFRMLGV